VKKSILINNYNICAMAPSEKISALWSKIGLPFGAFNTYGAIYPGVPHL
jgi:hypothetical protein